MKFDIDIVYFINTYINNTYPYLLEAQLKDLLSTKVLDKARLYIECCGTDPLFLLHVQRILGKYMDRTTVSMHPENNHEYYGIHRVWTQSQEYAGDPDRYILCYFHSKGISHDTFSKENAQSLSVKKIFDTVLRPWEKVMDIFNKNRHIDKVGHSFHPQGFVWFNFWWVRGSYCRLLEKPIETQRRHYYEDYLCRRPISPDPRFEQHDREEIVISHDIYHLSCENCYGLVLHDAEKDPSVVLATLS